MKKIAYLIKNIITIMIIFQMMFMPISNASFWDDVMSAGDNFILKGRANVGSLVEQDDLNETISVIYNALLVLGVVLAVIMGAILGIKFMVGSVEEQAKIKEILLPYATGCIVTFGAFGIWKLLMSILGKI